ncbi:hypothetical protein [Streptomyces longwoodensis]|uniref:hypothetical protein n=1 Tax=Streptomyces longwoodensis TaxID=68231 RepID=UPI00225A29DF|nr:hypothetical protein [Streptomyces longwoodensis]MCX5000901.1 hypothetical protein [Streptomyces longwoodensis]
MTVSEERQARLREIIADQPVDGISPSRLTELASGRHAPTSLEYALIATARETTVLWILNGVDDEQLMLEQLARRYMPHAITLEDMQDRFQRGGEAYRTLVWRGHEAFLEALANHSEPAPGGPDGQTAGLVDALHRHETPEQAVRIANEYWADNYDRASKQAWEAPDGGSSLLTEAHYTRLAVFEYAWPGNQDKIIKLGLARQSA